MEIFNQLQESKKFLLEKKITIPQVVITLGSGLGRLAERVEKPITIPFEEVPHFPKSGVAGHAGKLIFGQLSGKSVLLYAGRVHCYEGHHMERVTYPTRLAIALGAKTAIFTNAGGGINRTFAPGDLMVLTDHLNFQPNPLIGPNDERLGPRFVSNFDAYTPQLIKLVEKIALEKGIPLRKGVYVAVTGPSYCGAAELRMFKTLGADAIGMSTVPEVIVARHMGLEKIIGLTCITDMATGEGAEEVSHELVVKTAKKAEVSFIELISGVVSHL